MLTWIWKLTIILACYIQFSKTHSMSLGRQIFIPTGRNVPSTTSPRSQYFKNRILLCYYNIPRLDDRPYSVFPEALNSSLCTHLVVCSAKIGSHFTLEPQDIQDIEFYDRTLKLKKRNPKLKILLSLESVNDETGIEFVSIVSSPDKRQRFYNHSVEFLNSRGFDGLEINWKYPCFYGPSRQKQLFSEFLRDFRQYISNSSSKLLLTAAVPPEKEIIDIGYDIESLAIYLDFVSLMSYDFHAFTWLSPFTGPNAPLHHLQNEHAYFSTLNVEWSSNYWYENGMPASKILVGIQTYGRSYTLMSEDNHGYYALAKGVGKTGYQGLVTFPEVCKFLRSSNNATVILDNSTFEPYAFSGDEWISYDDEKSAQIKATWITQSGFGGVAVRSLNSDDAYKLCRFTRTGSGNHTYVAFPITRVIYKTLFNNL